MSAKLPAALVKIASAEIGVEEIDGTNSGPRVNEYKATTNLPADEPWPWCAAFVDWCVLQAMNATGTPETATFRRPTTAGAYALEAWSMAQDESTWTKKPAQKDIQPGDIIVFTFSHCGIAVSAPDGAGFFQTVEGNTDTAGSREGGGVFKKWRRTGQVRSRIRFRV